MPLTNQPNIAPKSIQRGVISTGAATSATATIAAVNTAKTMLHYGGNSVGSTGDAREHTYLELTNATTITARRNAAVGGTNISWEAIEWP